MVDNSEVRRMEPHTLCGYIFFFVFTFLGVLYLLSASYDPSVAFIRLIIGIFFIITAIVLPIIISFVIEKIDPYKEKIIEGEPREEFIPSDIICRNCGHPIELTDNLKRRRYVICEKCGENIKIPKSTVNW